MCYYHHYDSLMIGALDFYDMFYTVEFDNPFALGYFICWTFIPFDNFGQQSKLETKEKQSHSTENP